MKNYGHFDQAKREYVITNPMTPEPWINYLDGNSNLRAFVSNGAGGTVWHGQAHTGRLTRYRLNGLPMDTPGFYVYIKDGNDVWCPSYFPTMTELDRWECRHGMGYTCFNAVHENIRVQLKYLIPLNDEILLWDLTIKNCSKTPRQLEIYPYIDYSLHDFDKDTLYFLVCGNQAKYRWDNISGGLLSDYFAFEAPFPGNTLFSASESFTEFDMNRNKFIGRGRTEANAIGLWDGLKNTEVKDGGFYACGVFKLHFTLQPGQSKRVIIKLAAGTSLNKIRYLSEKYNSTVMVDNAIEELNTWWKNKLERSQVETPDSKADEMLNVWLPKNIHTTMRNGRSISHRHSGNSSSLRFRDTMQDIMAGIDFSAERTRGIILLLMQSITASGRIVTSIDPTTYICPTPQHTRSDAIVWGVLTLYKYLAETGDITILDEVIPYYDDNKGCVLEHLIRGMHFIGKNIGEKGLPRLFDCDWNDMLQVFANAKVGGESVMLAEQYIYSAKLLIEILEYSGHQEEIQFFENKINDFSEILASDICWDGAWFKRLLYPNAEIGSKSNTEGKIFLNTQSWAAISGALPEKKVRIALDNVTKMLDTECGIRLFTPPFTTMMDGVTPFNTNAPGAGENGGLFLHANTWAIIAETMMKNPRQAWKYFSQILPNNLSKRNPEHYGREPYAFASWIYGPDHDAFGHAALTWLTGGAAWVYIAGTEYILGIRSTLKGLVIDPCIPPEWNGFKVKRIVRGAEYHINVSNPYKIGCGITKLTIGGKSVDNNTIPYELAGKIINIAATIDGKQSA